MGLTDTISSTVSRVRSGLTGRNLGKSAINIGQYGLSGMMTPFAYLGGLQQGGWKGGQNQAYAINNDPAEFWNDPHNRAMMGRTAAEVALIAASAGMGITAAGGGGMTAAGATSVPSVAALSGPVLTGGGLAAASVGAGTGAAALGAQTYTEAEAQRNRIAASAPPDVNEANDPATAQQFLRIRKAARMLGRAGTIKYKGTETLGGDGNNLGTSMGVAG